MSGKSPLDSTQNDSILKTITSLRLKARDVVHTAFLHSSVDKEYALVSRLLRLSPSLPFLHSGPTSILSSKTNLTKTQLLSGCLQTISYAQENLMLVLS